MNGSFFLKFSGSATSVQVGESEAHPVFFWVYGRHQDYSEFSIIEFAVNLTEMQTLPRGSKIKRPVTAYDDN